ncbi:hypothetical protein TW85_03535 [Marinomonas sp. S3726]|uniref:DegT/DnrJ/EryC1/StrS family aminotransferase n=1 Tax=Marinomonas sp. S3726 TaxID=579484 RepID=UPI0005F9C3D9|nr:DegT/DnrJ/EryC1/StrS family aminotransferase [Marinomonas sp. S3726]KJZ15965.1 hypothetical protein TW85_03535 [Marinomonas sp. S3726]
MKYNTAFPFFYESDIQDILSKTEDFLRGNGMLSMGKYVHEFEQKFSQTIGAQHSIAVTSCTAALETVLTSMGIGVADEVIVPAQTFIATGSSVVRVGARPVFCEVNENFILDFSDLKQRITKNTKAVMLVHFAGIIHDDVFEIKKYLNERDIYLIEDAAHAHGASINGVYAGNLGDAACFSFFSTKNTTTGEGGMITTNNPELAKKCDSIRHRGKDMDADCELFNCIGTNLRLTEFQALLGLTQLNRLNEFISHRNAVAKIYNEKLSVLFSNNLAEGPEIADGIVHAYWRYWIRLGANIDRENIQLKMAENAIKTDWAYSPLVHLQPVFKEMYGNEQGMLPLSEAYAQTHICLPIHFSITLEDAEFIADEFIKVVLAEVPR